MMTEPTLPTGSEFGARPAGAPTLVLVVETTAYAARLLQEADTAGGLGVEAARDPAGALDRLRRQRFDAVVINLPNQGQIAERLFHAIAELDPETADRVVFVVGDLSDPATRRYLTAAGRPFLTQPVEPGQLYDLVLRVAGRRTGGSG